MVIMMGHPSAGCTYLPDSDEASGTKHAKIRSFAVWRKIPMLTSILCVLISTTALIQTGAGSFAVRRFKGTRLHPGRHRKSCQNSGGMAKGTHSYAVPNPSTGCNWAGFRKLVLE